MSWPCLLQETLLAQSHGRWRMLVGCSLLNVTTRTQAERVWPELFRRWPTPMELALADHGELAGLLRPLGCYNRRARTLVRLSDAWCWRQAGILGGSVADLPGVGPYAADSWDIFVLGHTDVDPEDKELRRYLGLKRRRDERE